MSSLAREEKTVMKEVLEAILAGDTSSQDYAALPLPASYRGVTVHADEVGMFEGLPTRAKDPREALHVEGGPGPGVGRGGALVGVMASSINYNTVWTSIFEPIPT